MGIKEQEIIEQIKKYMKNSNVSYVEIKRNKIVDPHTFQSGNDWKITMTKNQHD